MVAGVLMCGLPAGFELLRDFVCCSLHAPDEAVCLETARGGSSVIGVPENIREFHPAKGLSVRT